MSQTSYQVFVDLNSYTIQVDSDATLADVRTALGSNIATSDIFLYFNPVTNQKTACTSAQEATVTAASASFPAASQGANPAIQTVSNSTASPSFLGTVPPSGYVNNNPQFGVQVVLNETDQDAITNNQGMFKPLMLENIQSVDPNNPVTFTYAAICQKGAIIQFNISSWGAAGFGYSITSAMSLGANICDGLFVSYSGDYGQQVTTSLQRYASTGYTIQIEANESLSIASQYNVAYSTITINSWSLSSWTDLDGNTWSSQIPIPNNEADFAAGGDPFDPPPPSGTTVIPGTSVVSATPTAGPPSGQTFGGIESATPGSCPNTRSTGLVGSIQLYFLVFDSQADAETVIQVLNSPTRGFGNN